FRDFVVVVFALPYANGSRYCPPPFGRTESSNDGARGNLLGVCPIRDETPRAHRARGVCALRATVVASFAHGAIAALASSRIAPNTSRNHAFCSRSTRSAKSLNAAPLKAFRNRRIALS